MNPVDQLAAEAAGEHKHQDLILARNVPRSKAIIKTAIEKATSGLRDANENLHKILGQKRTIIKEQKTEIKLLQQANRTAYHHGQLESRAAHVSEHPHANWCQSLPPFNANCNCGAAHASEEDWEQKITPELPRLKREWNKFRTVHASEEEAVTKGKNSPLPWRTIEIRGQSTSLAICDANLRIVCELNKERENYKDNAEFILGRCNRVPKWKTNDELVTTILSKQIAAHASEADDYVGINKIVKKHGEACRMAVIEAYELGKAPAHASKKP